MKKSKLLVLLIALSLSIGMTACTDSSVDTDMIAETTVLEIPAQKSFASYELDIDKIEDCYVKKQCYDNKNLDFLNFEQKETFLKGLVFVEAMSHGGLANTCDIEGYCEQTEENASIWHTGILYESFDNYIKEIFTDTALKQLSEVYYNKQGELCYTIGDRGQNLLWRGGEYSLIEKDEERVVFSFDSQYSVDETETPDIDYTEESVIKLYKTDDGWKMDLFEFWY